MNCPNCGTSNLDNATICINCGRPLTAAGEPPASTYTPPPPPPPPSAATYIPPTGPGGPAPGPAIPNYLVQSILVTLCCCLPLGIVAIIFAAQVNQKLAAGDVAGARDASSKAKMFCWIAFGLGIAAMLLYGMFFGVGIANAIRESAAHR